MDRKTRAALDIIEAVKKGKRSLADLTEYVLFEIGVVANDAAYSAVQNERAFAAEQARNSSNIRTFNSPEIVQMMSERRKVEAIKLLRSATGAGLKDAKDEIERRIAEEPMKYGYLAFVNI